MSPYTFGRLDLGGWVVHKSPVRIEATRMNSFACGSVSLNRPRNSTEISGIYHYMIRETGECKVRPLTPEEIKGCMQECEVMRDTFMKD
jgi:hypothetical protein